MNGKKAFSKFFVDNFVFYSFCIFFFWRVKKTKSKVIELNWFKIKLHFRFPFCAMSVACCVLYFMKYIPFFVRQKKNRKKKFFLFCSNVEASIKCTQRIINFHLERIFFLFLLWIETAQSEQWRGRKKQRGRRKNKIKIFKNKWLLCKEQKMNEIFKCFCFTINCRETTIFLPYLL